MRYVELEDNELPSERLARLNEEQRSLELAVMKRQLDNIQRAQKRAARLLREAKYMAKPSEYDTDEFPAFSAADFSG
ncbi:hypothetical protein ANME2D_00542 [Candidatus Methanoperedens nitroreducens]|uniref:Uncharacterized protein n=1 Tax=Candidatus Methanoperedens nitratireducens TaxID=1392998 RepID=A0A062VCV8_9EURY|nr:hypothetical protein [Candidatus Methanoperedens nitroreducens]KCZ73474.1 hypothetical protein ANME2D_00542 [Candidatus Methanoperedens nitroreducens]MDJ1422570.1 hypothetical protein [Candidatus Methanoperedens sp.]